MANNTKKTFLVSAALYLALMLFSAGCAKDQTPPQVRFTSPTVPAGGTLLRKVKFAVEAYTNGDKSIARVEFSMDGVPLPHGMITSPPYEVQWEATDKFGLTRKVTATAYDNAGASASASIQVKFFNGVEKAPMPTSRYAFTSNVVDNKIYVIGGFDFHFNLVEAYDPATDVWTTKTPSSSPHAAAAGCVIDGKIYVFGGGTNAEWVTDVEAYDPAADAWTKKAPIPFGSGASIGMNTCALAANGKAYLMGGLANPAPARVAEYDPVTDRWNVTNSSILEFGAAALNLNGLIYFIGGCEFRALGICPSAIDALQSYDPATGAWTSHSPMITPRADFCATSDNGKIYVMGGAAKSPTLPPDPHMEVYDPQTDKWTVLPDLPEGLANFGCNAVNGKIYIIGPKHVYEYSPD